MLTRDKSLAALADAGMDTSMINDQVPDELLDQFVNLLVNQGQNDQPSEEPLDQDLDSEEQDNDLFPNDGDDMGDDDSMGDDDMGDEDMDMGDDDMGDMSDEGLDDGSDMGDDDMDMGDEEDDDYDPDLEEFMDGMDDDPDDMEMYMDEIGDGIDPKDDGSPSKFNIGETAPSGKPHPKKITTTRQYAEDDLVFTKKEVESIVKGVLRKHDSAVAQTEAISKFCERMVEAGKMLPGQVKAYSNLLNIASKDTKVRKFGEKKVTALQQAMKTIENGPILFRFGEKLPDAENAKDKMSPAKKQALLGMTHLGQQALKNK